MVIIINFKDQGVQGSENVSGFPKVSGKRQESTQTRNGGSGQLASRFSSHTPVPECNWRSFTS
jgi:hypothetical protein